VWAGVARAVVAHGWERFWLSCCLAVLASVIMVPVVRLCLRPRLPPRNPIPQAGRARGRHAAATAADLADDRRITHRGDDDVTTACARDEVTTAPPGGPDVTTAPGRGRGRPDGVTWPEVAALAGGYGLLLLVCAGVVDPMLP
jgi:hypothetical protein